MQGYEVLQAKNGKEAFNLAVEQQPDLIISDLGMPVWDGNRLLQEMQGDAILARIPFIILTAWADRNNMRKGLQAGAVDYITKPFSLAEIDEAVKSHLKRKRRMDQSVQSYAMSQVIPSILRHLPHELRTPMNGILAPSEMLMEVESGIPSEQVAHLGEIINLSALRLLRVVENMGLFLALKTQSRSSSASLKLTETLLASPMELFERVSEKALKRHSFPKKQLVLKGTINRNAGVPSDLEKVFEEVLDNACHYAAPNTFVVVEWQDSGDKGSLTITNQGPGMTAEQIDQINSFRQFERREREQQGLGLGLYIAKELARLNDATLTINSDKAGPTQVCIAFQLTPCEMD
jgi:signal transduction histidine kinase